ncbi:hypothetical protein HGRIS_009174 [Hohenbuehelia grisea]|uniref:LIM-domain binding protein-domain-containing protein n=1 Tax=Hohenbuehelia grisea TaxID=104357 RepID=A0ABR3J0H1_9AGAR
MNVGNIRQGVQPNPMLALQQQSQQQPRQQLPPNGIITDQQRFSLQMQQVGGPRNVPVGVNTGPPLFQRQQVPMMQPGMSFSPNGPNVVRRVQSQPTMSGVNVPPGALPMTMQGLVPPYRPQQAGLTPQQQQAAMRHQHDILTRQRQQQQHVMNSLPQQQNFQTIPSQVASSPRPMPGPGQLHPQQQNMAVMGMPQRPPPDLSLFQNPQFNPGVPGAQNQQRIPSNPRPPFNNPGVPVAGSPPHMGLDFSGGPSPARPGSSSGRGQAFLATPAQQFGEMHSFNQAGGAAAGMSGEAFSQQFGGMPPPRPPRTMGIPGLRHQVNSTKIHLSLSNRLARMQQPGMQGVPGLTQQGHVPRPPSTDARSHSPHGAQPQPPGSGPQMNGTNHPHMHPPNRTTSPSAHTSPPGMSSTPVPGSTLIPSARISQPQTVHQQQQSQGSPPGSGQQIAQQRPSQPLGNTPGAPPVPSGHGPVAGPSSVADASHPQMFRGQQTTMVAPALGSGQGLMRLLQFSACLAVENKQKLSLSFWNDLIKDYFTPNAVMKFTLWKDNQRQEAKPFGAFLVSRMRDDNNVQKIEINVPILPRFFLVTAQSGVKSMSLALDGVRERMFSHGHAIVECLSAVWTYRYNNGYSVTLKGPLTAHVIIVSAKPPEAGSPQSGPPYTLKFEDLQFDANFHDKYVLLDQVHGLIHPGEGQGGDSGRMMSAGDQGAVTMSSSTPMMMNGVVSHGSHLASREDRAARGDEPRLVIEHGSVPGEPVNAFGIPQATMRCLELAESVAQMSDLILFTRDTDLGPKEALRHYANKLRDQGFAVQPSALPGGNNNLPPPPPGSGTPGSQFVQYQPPNSNGMSSSGSQYPPSNSLSGNPGSGSGTSGLQNGLTHASHGVGIPNGTASSHATPGVLSPPSIPSSASNSPQKQHKTIPQPQNQGAAVASTPTATASTPGASGSTSGSTSGGTPSISHASLKRKQGTSETASPTVPHADGGPPTKRQARGTKKRTNTVSGT